MTATGDNRESPRSGGDTQRASGGRGESSKPRRGGVAHGRHRMLPPCPPSADPGIRILADVPIPTRAVLAR